MQWANDLPGDPDTASLATRFARIRAAHLTPDPEN
jgi:hypothetical protein